MRDAGRGGGYDYQWDVCSSLLLSEVLGRQTSIPQLAAEFMWLGPVTKVAVEGGDEAGMEDLSFWSDRRCLSFQIKEQTDENKKWKKSDKKVLEFLNRAALGVVEGEHHYVFLSNGDVEPKFEKARGSEDIFNLISAHLTEKLKAPVVATKEQVARLGKGLEFRRYLPPSDASALVLRDGVRFATQRLLHDAGVADPIAACRALYEFVKNASLEKGGTCWTIGELREALRKVCGLGLGAPGDHGVVLFVENMQSRRRATPGVITWDALADPNVLSWDEASLVALEKELATNGALLVTGGRGSGKSVLTSQLAYRAVTSANAVPVIWDLDGFGARGPDFASRFLAQAQTIAHVAGGKPYAIIENAHADLDSLSAVASVRARHSDVPLLVTSRVALSEQTFPVDTARLDLAATAGERGQRILLHHMQKVRGLSGDELRRALSAADWTEYANDLVVLMLALQAFDGVKLSLSLDGFHKYFDEHLATCFRQQAATDDLAFYLALLGRHGVAVDLRAVARVLARDEQVVLAAADALYAEGFLVLDAPRMLARFGHDSFAEAVWSYLLFRADQLATRARTLALQAAA